MKKDKIYELRIEEDDEISGIDSISLVSEPAIEINWVAFNKQERKDFQIPTGEDFKYSSMITEKGQSEQELFDQGWKVYDKKEFVQSSPNSPSFEDTDEYLIRYKYIKNPVAPGSPIKETTRDFCIDLLNKNLVYRVEDLEAIINDQGDSALVWRGGYNCRHLWQKITYHRDTKIVNKGSITKGRVDGMEGLDVMGYPQEDTRVPAHPSFSKIKMEIDDQNVNVFGYHTRYFAMCQMAQNLFRHLVTMEVDEDTKGMIRSAAQAADNVFRIELDVIKSQEATEHQYEEAVILVDDTNDIMAEVDKIVGMPHDLSFMNGHIEKIKSYLKEDLGYDNILPPYVDPDLPKKKKKQGFESYTDYPVKASENARRALKWAEKNGWGSCGTPVGKIRANQLANRESISEETIARMASFERHRQNKDVPYDEGCGGLMWDAWGGTEGIEWAQRKLERIRRDSMSKQRFQTDEEKKIVVGPAMIPNLQIPRLDKNKNPYYVYFTAETIKMIAEKYMRNKYIDNNDTEHDGKVAEDVYVIESWIKEDDQDKSNKYGFQDLPIGTWFVSMKVKNPEVWRRVKQGELKGFSVSGFFEEIEQFQKEQQFLKELAELLKQIK